MHFFELKINVDADFAEILIAELAEIGFDSFSEEIDSLSAFVEDNKFDEAATKQLMERYASLTPLSYELSTIERKNWNEEWEKSFEPINITNQIYVRADFHPAIEGFTHEIIITPKMSFGTGHHETTSMVLQHQLDIDHQNKKVLDIGCGTGILAILAAKLGASKVAAFDIDEWSVENTIENTHLNNCPEIEVRKGTIESEPHDKYDVLLANINRNILIDQIPQYVTFMAEKSVLVVSGFYEKDTADIEAVANQCGLEKGAVLVKNAWTSVVFWRK
jgi:ribosomal protein L11 methyltransferase